jgi:hypothetical protein
MECKDVLFTGMHIAGVAHSVCKVIERDLCRAYYLQCYRKQLHHVALRLAIRDFMKPV